MTRYRFSANTGFLWKELALPQRIRLAATHGFDAVEFHDEAQTADEGAVRAALDETGLPVLGLNVRMGDTAGCAALPGMADQARRDIDAAADTARRVGAGAIHVLSGKTQDASARTSLIASLRHALSAFDGTILIEPISRAAMPGYFLNSLDLARDIVAETGDGRVRILFDCFHVESEHGDVTAAFRSVAGQVGHVQIASVPERGEPWPSRIDYAVVLPALRACGYDGAFGCEYRPATTVEAGLGWRDELRRRLEA